MYANSNKGVCNDDERMMIFDKILIFINVQSIYKNYF